MINFVPFYNNEHSQISAAMPGNIYFMPCFFSLVSLFLFVLRSSNINVHRAFIFFLAVYSSALLLEVPALLYNKHSFQRLSSPCGQHSLIDNEFFHQFFFFLSLLETIF